jgi:hypothetical protein
MTQQAERDIMDPTIEEMRPRLLTLDQARTRLATTEPLNEFKFTSQPGVRFRLQDNWHEVSEESQGIDRMDSYVTLYPGGDEYQLTKDALLEAGAKVGIPRKLQERTPAHLLQPQLDWWFSGNGGWEDREFKGFVSGQAGPDSVPLMVAFGSGTISPFSNIGIIDKLAEGLCAAYRVPEDELLVDYKFTHSLELTHGRLIVPGNLRNITGPGTADPSDNWSTGVQWRNSQLGLRPVSVDGYLFRWRCTNGMCDTLVTSGKYNRRQSGHDEGDVYEWARASVDNVLGGLEHVLQGVQDSTTIPVESDVNLVLDDLFRQHNVPGKLQQEVIRNMADTGGELSMYTLIQAVTAVANGPGVAPAAVDKLMRLGGHIAHSAEKRCDSCRRLMPED